MKKVFAFVALCAVIALSGRTMAAEATYHIGVCPGTVSQGEDEFRSAEELIRRYGDADEGGIIKHITYPDNFSAEQETAISQMASFADDPLMKAVIINQSVPGTTEALRRIREARPDILLFAATNHEEPRMIASAADLVTHAESVGRGYLMILAAHRLGCTDFVHISFPRHMSSQLTAQRAAVMEATCNDLGMKYHFESAPDPNSDVGLPGAQQFILEHVPQWVNKYGPKTAFFCTNDGETEPLLKRIAEGQGYFIEADLPSPLMGYPGALGLNLADVAGDFPAILKRVEEAVIAKGGAGRMGTWAYSLGFTSTVALGEYAKDCIENGVTPRAFRRQLKAADVIAKFNEATPGAAWNASTYSDVNTGLQLKNMLMIYQDTYIFGKGYMHMTDEVIPEKYFQIK